ncbi:hypothetical protein F3Y22_tig00111650pilonHSYRG00041 [Hibiscus syriacus]|uniref:Reverse transcriptase zinc-binding domain-containing protein n=1 Tax=Hibiscus syriacus TaxID=106335 RepID=A0A6A2Y495_HIBSY|nr:hypothetical protein F3Y22_tig00111650pilonHSYRG00041 [Hibiscus syriacus]
MEIKLFGMISTNGTYEVYSSRVVTYSVIRVMEPKLMVLIVATISKEKGGGHISNNDECQICGREPNDVDQVLRRCRMAAAVCCLAEEIVTTKASMARSTSILMVDPMVWAIRSLDTRSLGKCSVLVVELWAIHEILSHAWRLRYRHVEMETDCLEAIRVCNKTSDALANNALRNIVNLASNEDDPFSSNVKCVVGEGQNIAFWDNAVPYLREAFPRIYNVAVKKQGMVCDFGSRSNRLWTWNIEVRRVVFEWEVHIWNAFMSTISNAVRNASAADCVRWVASPDGLFTPRSFCWLVSSAEAVSDPIWKILWSNLAPHKVEAFLWKLVQNRIPTFEELAKRGVPIADSAKNAVVFNNKAFSGDQIFVLALLRIGFWKANGRFSSTIWQTCRAALLRLSPNSCTVPLIYLLLCANVVFSCWDVLLCCWLLIGCVFFDGVMSVCLEALVVRAMNDACVYLAVVAYSRRDSLVPRM